MFRRRSGRLLTLAGIALGFLAIVLVGVIGDQTATISGIVVGEDGLPIAGAIVRIQAMENGVLTASDGTFTLRDLAEGQAVTVSGWKELHYCVNAYEVVPPADNVELVLRLYQTDDNPSFEWSLPISDDPDVPTCARCKADVTAIWLGNAHAGAGTNPRFFSMYNGTDTTGTRRVVPGYVDDFPGTAGVCATCHAPGAAIDAPYSTDMNELEGADVYGVHCDFCHKTANVYLDPATKLPYDNAPGVLSMDVRRPWPDTDRYELFFGTFDDDNVPEEDTKLSLIAESAFCATCHQFSFWGTPIYQSYREWLESPYAEEEVTCQMCHMPAPSVLDGEILTNVAPGFGGVERDPMTIHAHTQPGAADVELLQDTVELTLDLEQDENGSVVATVEIKNAKAGHHVPTDYPGRQMILVVTATDSEGRELILSQGPMLPAWCGAQAGNPGVAYAKVLRDVETGESPVVNYWKQTQIESDNRLAAFEVDRTAYRFAPGEGTTSVHAVVLFRRLYQDLADAKGWNMPDILMEEAEVSIDIQEAG